MKPFFIFFTLLFLSASQPCKAQRNQLTETKSNTKQQDFKKLLFIGGGSVEARAFLDVLTAKLIAMLKKKGITAEFYYKGKDTVQANKEISSILAANFDAAIYFNPIDSSQYSQIQYKKTTIRIEKLGNPTSNTYSRRVGYSESFDIQFTGITHPEDSIWAAILDVDCTVNENEQIKALAIKILTSFEKNKLIK